MWSLVCLTAAHGAQEGFSMKIELSGVTKLSKRIETILKGRKTSITYEGLCKVIHSRYGIRYRRNSKWICVALAQLMERDAIYGRFPRSALVVRGDTGLPGGAFFTEAKAVGYIFESESKFWADVMKAVVS